VISAHLLVHGPDREASRYLAAFIAENVASDGTSRIALSLPINLFADRRALIAPSHRDVLPATLNQRISCDLLRYLVVKRWPVYQIRWRARRREVLHDDCFGLVISDHYEPPFGAVGALFDAVLGQMIVHSLSNNQVIPSYKKRTSTLKKALENEEKSAEATLLAAAITR
jgi:hypothetical protein